MTTHRQRNRTCAGAALLGIALATSVPAETGTTIIGTQEAPTVLNVVPWQNIELRPRAWDGTPSTAQSVLEESLQPIDRDVLRREIDYFNLLHHSAEPAENGPE